MYQFTEDCFIGISEIDEEHQYLFQLLNEAVDVLGMGNRNEIKETEKLLSKLGDYAVVHFAHEEAYMEDTNDPELLQQRREHDAFLRKVRKELAKTHDSRESLASIVEFLTRWLYHHILSSDMMIGKMPKKAENPFAYTEKYDTGIALIDEEHRRLFAIIEQTNDLAHDDMLMDKYDDIVDIIGELKRYTEKHFADEEAYMEKIAYPQLEAQKRAHDAFVDKLDAINFQELDSIDEHQQEYLEGLIDFLAGWLINHILKMDKVIGEFMIS